MGDLKLIIENTDSMAWIVAAGVILIIALILYVKHLTNTRKLYSHLKDTVRHPEQVKDIIQNRYNDKFLLAKSKVVERFAASEGPGIITLIGMDRIWVQSLKTRKRKVDMERILKFAPDLGLFTCFLVSLDRSSLAKRLMNWLKESGDMLYMRRLALSGKGEEFDGKKALSMFSDNLDEIREMTGDPEWASRYFAVKVLLYDDDKSSIRAVSDLFNDSHPLIRKTLLLEYKSETPENMYQRLYTSLIHDPVAEVRDAAWKRISNDFKEMYTPDFSKLNDIEYLHVLPFFRPDSKEDENIALKLLEGDNLELRFSAARYLEKNGVLSRLMLSADRGDMKIFDQTFTRLVKACEVNITSFLNSVEKTSEISPLLLAARLLIDKGERQHLLYLTKKVFDLYDGSSAQEELFRTTLQCISKRGNTEILEHMKNELVKRKYKKDQVEAILSVIPDRADYIFVPTLLNFFKDPSFKSNKALRMTLLKMPKDLVLPDIIEILSAQRDKYDHCIRRQALKLLGETRCAYCLQTILENLPIFPVQEAKDFAKIFTKFPQKEFIRKVNELLDCVDAKVRASLITVLPVTGDKSYINKLGKSLKDADPDVRVACVWALVEFKDTSSINSAISLLRDPVERVRVEVAKALGSYGTKKIIDELVNILNDRNEVESVKEAVIAGLGQTDAPDAINVLAGVVENDVGLKDSAIEALSRKTDKKQIDRLIEVFKDSSPDMREQISLVFKTMREKSEERIDALLREDIGSLKPYISDILDTTGYVESKIRRLTHRDPVVRREAAETLSIIGTTSAFRGMVLAARDPDEDVRVRVIKALEKLESKAGKKVLDELLNDPDRKVRKYTLWAMERLKAKGS